MEETSKKTKKKGWSQAQRKYSASSKGREARLRYQNSEKGKQKHREYLARRRAKKLEAKQTQAKKITPVQVSTEVVKIKKEVAKK